MLYYIIHVLNRMIGQVCVMAKFYAGILEVLSLNLGWDSGYSQEVFMVISLSSQILGQYIN
jgi:hypothetical protein